MKPKKSIFSWFVNIEEASITNLISEIQTTYPDIDINNSIVLTFVAGDERDVILNDYKLKQKLRVLARVHSYHITVNLETRMYIHIPLFSYYSKLMCYAAQRAFTDYTFPMVCNLFGLPENHQLFPKLIYNTIPLTGTSESNALKHLLAELQLRWDTTGIDMSNEATHSEYVYSFLVAAASLYKGSIVIRPQQQIRGNYGRGPVDFALEARAGSILGVTEVKKEDFKKGIAQNLVQLESAFSCKKRKYSDITNLESATGESTTGKTYGIVTDAQMWYILECTTNSGGLSFHMSKLSTQINYSEEGWEKKAEYVFGCLVWLLNQMHTKSNNRIRND